MAPLACTDLDRYDPHICPARAHLGQLNVTNPVSGLTALRHRPERRIDGQPASAHAASDGRAAGKDGVEAEAHPRQPRRGD